MFKNLWRASWDPQPQKKIKSEISVVGVEQPQPQVLELHSKVETLRNGTTTTTTTKRKPRKRR
jgi:hypothetical protein